LIQDKVLKVQTVKRFIMDECDQLLEVSLRRAVQTIFKACPLDKQVMMFTATLSEDNKRIAHKFCSDVRLDILLPEGEAFQFVFHFLKNVIVARSAAQRMDLSWCPVDLARGA
jgi:superfamily II DNA/RNA helicase